MKSLLAAALLVGLAMQAPGARSTGADGFVKHWLLLEPIKVSGQLTDSAVRETVAKEYFADQLTVVPHDGDTVTVGGDFLTWHAVDTADYNVNLYHFAAALKRPTSNVLFWAVTIVEAPRELAGVRLAIGSNAASIWWLNGQEVTAIYNDRQTVIDDGVSKRVTLKRGANVIRAAVINAGGATDFCARFLDADDAPVAGLVTPLLLQPGRGRRPSGTMRLPGRGFAPLHGQSTAWSRSHGARGDGWTSGRR